MKQDPDALNHPASVSAEEARALRIELADTLIERREYRQVAATLEPLLRDSSTPMLERARAMARCGWAQFFLGDLATSIAQCGEAAELLSPTSHHDDFAKALRWLGHGYRYTGQTQRAANALRDALAAARRGTDLSQQGFSLEALGQLARLQGRYAEAIELHGESLLVNEALGARKNLGFDWFHIALAQIYLGKWAEAAEGLDRATDIFVELADERVQIPVLIARCRLARRLGDADSAQGHAERALALARASSYRRAMILANEELASLLLDSGKEAEAIEILESALADSEAMAADGDLVYEVAWRLARAIEVSDPERAAELASRSVRLARAAGDRRELGSAYVALGRIRGQNGRVDDAVSLVREGLREFEAIGAVYELAEAHEAAADVLGRVESLREEAAEHRTRARAIYADLGAMYAVARLDAAAAVESSGSRRTRSEAAAAAPASGTPLSFDPQMDELFATVRAMAPYDTTVLIEGETGSGKEIVARLLHEAGPRAKRPFVPLNCAAFPAALLESELFGHRKGAFTGADRDYSGRLAAAQDGTVLLDEIDKASRDFQAKLLRAIEDRRVHPVGSTESVPLRARLVCATNRNLRALADQGSFLADLYFRLSAFRLRVPPLRERPEDIRGFVRHYVRACEGRFGSRTYTVSKPAMRALLAYPWPGNVRELKNVVESAAFFAREVGVIEPTHLPPEIVDATVPRAPVSLPERIESLERSEIELALDRAGGNKSAAARILGVSRKGLLDRLRRLGIE